MGFRDRQVMVTGESHQIATAIDDLLDVIATYSTDQVKRDNNNNIIDSNEDNNNNNHNMNDGNNVDHHNSNAIDPNIQTSVRLVIADSTIPILLGKEGKRISQVRQTSNAKITVNTNPNSSETMMIDCLHFNERTVVISGKVNDVRDATQQIVEICQEDNNLNAIMNFSAVEHYGKIQRTR